LQAALRHESELAAYDGAGIPPLTAALFTLLQDEVVGGQRGIKGFFVDLDGETMPSDDELVAVDALYVQGACLMTHGVSLQPPPHQLTATRSANRVVGA
jgi:hypothetical protein